MRRSLTLPLVMTTLLLAGCGASSPEAGPASSSGDASLRLAERAELTEGRMGAATRDTGAGAPSLLSPGGALDPADPPSGPDRRDGVGAGDACADPQLAPTASSLERVQASTLCLLNGERADRGLSPLSLEARLSRAARTHAADMVAKSYFAHEGANGSTIRDRIQATGYLPSAQRWVIGENLAWGTGALASPKAIVNAWMNSPGHRANVLHAEYREIGFGIVLGNPKATNGFGATYANAFGAVGDATGVKVDRVTTAAGKAGGTPAAKRRASVRRRAAARRSAARKSAARRARASRLRASRARAARE